MNATTFKPGCVKGTEHSSYELWYWL